MRAEFRTSEGQLVVDLMVEKQETFKLLEGDKKILTENLNKFSKAEVSIEHKSSSSSHSMSQSMVSALDKNENHADVTGRVKVQDRKIESSADRMEMFKTHNIDLPDFNMNQENQSFSQSDSHQFKQSSQSAESQQKFGDKSSRDEAMSKWEELWKKKATA
jgi:hypothetical protein